MSKFIKPKPAAPVTQADIDRVIEGADAVDDRKPEPKAQAQTQAAEDVRFTMTLPADMAEQIDRARKKAGRLTRLSWIRLAVAEKLARDGI
jgi:hypothetical protein